MTLHVTTFYPLSGFLSQWFPINSFNFYYNVPQVYDHWLLISSSPCHDHVTTTCQPMSSDTCHPFLAPYDPWKCWIHLPHVHHMITSSWHQPPCGPYQNQSQIAIHPLSDPMIDYLMAFIGSNIVMPCITLGGERKGPAWLGFVRISLILFFSPSRHFNTRGIFLVIQTISKYDCPAMPCKALIVELSISPTADLWLWWTYGIRDAGYLGPLIIDLAMHLQTFGFPPHY